MNTFLADKQCGNAWNGITARTANIVGKSVYEDIFIHEHTAPHRNGGRMLKLNNVDIDDLIFRDDDQLYVSDR